jgi:hypothetical protein
MCETGTSSIFSFSDPVIPLVLLLEIECCIGPDRKNLHSGTIRCLLSGVENSLKGRFPLGGIFRAERNFSLSCDFSGGTN